MAKQCGPNPITGTIGGTTYYKMKGEFYARAKSSLERDRVKRDPKFANTRRNAGWFAEASHIKSAVFQSLIQLGLDNSDRIDRKMQARSLELLRSGRKEDEIKQVLLKEFEYYVLPVKKPAVQKRKALPINDKIAAAREKEYSHPKMAVGNEMYSYWISCSGSASIDNQDSSGNTQTQNTVWVRPIACVSTMDN